MNDSSNECKVGSLKPDLRNLDMTVKIVNIGDSRIVFSRRGEKKHLVAEALVGDETGVIVLTLWDDQIKRFKAGDTIKIKNGYTMLFRGSLRLNTGKSGVIEKAEEEITEVNARNNLSERTYVQIPWHLSESSPYRRRRRKR
ncbi:single-stranded DNA-binding protein [Candidatus Bathyarchaeota archaeon]|nr:MAG: single-stranded DNA-binding protein [Candidatus Bathyarchaeota archaeon]